MRARHRVRQAVNLANGSTLAGVGIALAGRAQLARAKDGLLTGTGYKLPVPAVPAFTVGSVVVARADSLSPDTALFRHEARHTTQYAWCGGVLMLPLYFAAAGVSWLLCGDFSAWNVFERQAGLSDGGYAERELRPGFVSLRSLPGRRLGPGRASGTTRSAAVPGDRDSGPGQAAPAGSSATVSP
jgi:hypothetical protein